MLHHAAFIAARRLDADTGDTDFGQVGRKGAPAGQSVGDLPTFGSTLNRDVEFELGGIDSSRRYASLCHLRRPCLVKRTKLFRQPSGSDEGAGAITLRGSQKRLRAEYDPIASGLPRIAVRGRPFLSEHPDNIRLRYYKGGLGEAITRRRKKARWRNTLRYSALQHREL